MLEFCLGELQLKPRQLETLTWADYTRLGRGYFRRQERRTHRTRWLAAIFVSALGGEAVQPADLWPLELDNQPAAAPPSVPSEPVEERLARLRQLDADLFSS